MSKDTMRDYQRSKVYSWEDSSISDRGGLVGEQPGKLSIAQCQTIVDYEWARAKAPGAPPVVVARKSQRASCYNSAKHHIGITFWGRRVSTVLHETTHGLQWRFVIVPKEAWHGPWFVARYIEMSHRYGLGEAHKLYLQALACGLDVVVYKKGEPNAIQTSQHSLDTLAASLPLR